MERDIGKRYKVVLWQEKLETVEAEVRVTGTEDFEVSRATKARAIVIDVPVEADDLAASICIEQLYSYHSE